MIVFDNNIEYLLAFISAIFGLSIPIMLQVIERVDQRYESTRLTERLKSERTIKATILCMIVSLISCTYAVFVRFPSLWDFWILNNSANLIAIFACLALIFCFLLSCRVILVYYSPEKLQERILNTYSKSKTEVDKERHFLDWVDLTKILLEASDRGPALKVYDTIGKEVYNAFDKAGDEGVVFPPYLIRGITSVNENLCVMPRRPFSINNGNQILKNLISHPSKLSDEAYRLLWNNLLLQLYYGQEDWVYEYWSAAVQVYDFDLAQLYDGYPSFKEPDKAVSKSDVKKRNEERQRFLEFHITLCANILREKRYDLLEKIIDYIRVWPPEYPLVPSSISDIIQAFRIVEESPRFDMGVEGHYPMRGMKGIVDGIVLGSVKRYLTFLFVRVFSNIGRIENTYANYPTSLGGLKRMEEDIDYIKRMLPSIIGNKELMSVLSVDDMNEAERRMKDVLENIKADIKTKQKEFRERGPQDADLIAENLNEVKILVNKQFVSLDCFVKESKKDSDESYYLKGTSSYLFPNEAFQKDSGISYVNMAETTASSSISNIQHGFASVFFQKPQKRYRINNEEIFTALDRLQINKEFSVVAFDIYWDYYLHKGINSFEKKDDQYFFKGIPIICLHGGPTDLVSQTIFVLKKSDLPSLSFIEPVAKHIEKYALNQIDDKYKVFASIVQLSTNVDLLDRVDNMSKEEAKEHSLFNVFINAKMSFAKNAPVVSFKLMYNMRDNGSADSVNNIVPFTDLFEEEEKNQGES